ncbi:MAG: hypothetical protein ACOCRX_05925 [Candidatus Woesearchaeota archaeon]
MLYQTDYLTIKDKNYADKYKIEEKEIVLIGINGDTEKKNVERFEIEYF